MLPQLCGHLRLRLHSGYGITAAPVLHSFVGVISEDRLVVEIFIYAYENDNK